MTFITASFVPCPETKLLQSPRSLLYAQTSNSLNFVDIPTTQSPSLLLSDMVTSDGKTFEAVAPDTTIIIGFTIVFILSVVASVVWANEVVPVSRTKLALSKRDGEVREYLEELKQGSYDALSEQSVDTSELSEKNVEIRPDVGDGRDIERWLFSDWLNSNKSAGGGRKKEPALPILKKAKWNSGDNPILVTTGIMMIGIVIASITERIN